MSSHGDFVCLIFGHWYLITLVGSSKYKGLAPLALVPFGRVRALRSHCGSIRLAVVLRTGGLVAIPPCWGGRDSLCLCALTHECMKLTGSLILMKKYHESSFHRCPKICPLTLQILEMLPMFPRKSAKSKIFGTPKSKSSDNVIHIPNGLQTVNAKIEHTS